MAGPATRVAVERCGKQPRYKFDHGEEVLDYFDVPKAHVINPSDQSEIEGISRYNQVCVSGKTKFASAPGCPLATTALSQKELGRFLPDISVIHI
jgi:hypothetical protein